MHMKTIYKKNIALDIFHVFQLSSNVFVFL